MPYRRRKTTRRRPRRGRKRVTRGGRRPRISSRVPFQTYNFTRDLEQDLDLGRIATGGTGPFNLYYTADGGIAGSYSLRLDQLPNYAEFAPLFKQYRLVAVKTYIYPAANSFTAGTGVNTQNNNIMIRMAPNQTGQNIAAGNTVQDWNQLQAKKRWVIRPDRPIIFFTKLKQLVNVQSGVVGPALGYTVKRPSFIETTSPEVLHYGNNIRFDPVDVTNPMVINNDSFPHMKIIQKLYFQTRGVK